MSGFLDVNRLSVEYGHVPAVHDVSFSVHEGEIVALLGVNGAGKTSVLRGVLGLASSRSGSRTFDGVSLASRPPSKIVKDGVGYVPEGRRIFPGLSVEENLTVGGWGNPAASLQIGRVFKIFPRLEERRRQRAGSLSGGEQQMLAVGRALVSSPRLLMIDELSLGLSPNNIDALYARLVDLHADGLTLLIVEQFVDRALAIADRAYILEKGRVAYSGPAVEVREWCESAYIGGMPR